MTPYARPKIFKQDIINVNKVLKSQYLTTGPEILKFEKKLSSLCKSRYALTSNSATSALHLCCLALGLTKNDYVWTSSITFVASANCALYCGAKIELVDIDPDSLNISIEKLEKKLIKARDNNKLPKIIIPVHLGGNPCEMKSLKKLSKKYKFKIIEDASHAIGASYDGSLIGSCSYSDACVFSFHPVKIITTGEGGAMLTNNKDIASKFSMLRSHGIVRDKLLKKSHYAWYYEQRSLGYNYRMNEMEASLGSSQLNKLKKFIKERNEIANYYKKNLNSKIVKFQKVDKFTRSSYHLFIIRTNKTLRKIIYDKLKENGITTSFHYIPVYRQPYYKKFKFSKKNFLVSEEYYNDGLSIPLYCGFNKKTQDKVIKIINNITKD
ncbi:UDP-4-amino-4,6-dideoxy-N-acetyl-beta-L-altrosamine transaminase [Candidatus Pelagibacter sp.]|nr:UDP-4-amino-4,6-dideoxy-N-acetyl-beta-L-altrosamine transaminase [Candidatus Pelagibacter sp.]